MTANADARIALVTGANKGIGKAIVQGLARDGFIVYLGARSPERGRTAAAELKADGAVHFVQLDVLDPASVRAAAQTIESEAGRPDVLVNNAGISSAPGSRFRTPAEEIAEDMRTVMKRMSLPWFG
jgi:NAD(P)-dependent dehydrogenase (short-subunit alcohol dehydrogenase family)